MRFRFLLPLVVIAALAACSGDGALSQTTNAPPTTAAPSTAALPTTTVTVAPTVAPSTLVPTTTSAPPTTTRPAPTTTEIQVPLMPDVVCLNLQDAQDEIQQAGVWYSRSRDFTGAGRSQIFDRTWLVVDQEPTPGSPIAEGDPLLYVVKYTEDNDCGL
jgi:ABC-type transport system substrate-binding protein